MAYWVVSTTKYILKIKRLTRYWLQCGLIIVTGILGEAGIDGQDVGRNGKDDVAGTAEAAETDQVLAAVSLPAQFDEAFLQHVVEADVCAGLFPLPSL